MDGKTPRNPPRGVTNRGLSYLIAAILLAVFNLTASSAGIERHFGPHRFRDPKAQRTGRIAPSGTRPKSKLIAPGRSRRGSLQRELVLVVIDHLLALGRREVIRVADRVYSATASPMKLIFPSAGPTDRC